MKNLIFLVISLLFIISCGKEPIEPFENPNLREGVTSIIFKSGEEGTDCEFIMANRQNNETVYYIPKGLHDTLKYDYLRFRATFEVTTETVKCEHDHPDMHISEDETNFLVANIITAEAF